VSLKQKTVLVTRKLPSAVEQKLASIFRVRLNDADRRYTADELIERARGADAILVTVTDRLDGTLIADLPLSVGILANFGVGYDHIDIEAARARGLTVTNTPGVLTDATADIAMLLILGAARGAGAGHLTMVRNEWKGWSPSFIAGRDLKGRRLSLLGMGRIGTAVARRAVPFGMTVHYHNRRRLPPDLEAGAVYHPRLDDLLSVADILSIHLPSTPETKHIVGAEALARLPQGAILVNTARGNLVDDEAVLAALRSGRLAAAGFDVFAGEPDIHPGYREAPNVLLLPHLGSSTVETRNAMGFLAIDNLTAFFGGREPPNRIL